MVHPIGWYTILYKCRKRNAASISDFFSENVKELENTKRLHQRFADVAFLKKSGKILIHG